MTFPHPEQDESITDNLYPGARWERSAKGKSRVVTVVLVTNQGLGAELLAKNPMQVVFQRASGQLLSMAVEQFVKGRTFLGTEDAHIASVIAQLIDPPTDDEVIDIDRIQLEEDPVPEQAAEEVADTAEDASEPEPTEDPDAGYIPVFEPQHFTWAEVTHDLDDCFLHAEELPFGGTDDADLMCLTFDMPDTNAVSVLEAAFSSIGTFTLDTDSGLTYYRVVEFVNTKRRFTNAGRQHTQIYILVSEGPDPAMEPSYDEATSVEVKEEAKAPELVVIPQIAAQPISIVPTVTIG
jgi:hypothetical protein